MAAGAERSARGLKIHSLSLVEHRMLAGLAASGRHELGAARTQDHHQVQPSTSHLTPTIRLALRAASTC
jgi:hypothetical protein